MEPAIKAEAVAVLVNTSRHEEDVTDDIKTTDDIAEDTCSICLQTNSNPALINPCFHKFCFQCILQWLEMANRCPLCLSQVEYLIHDIRSADDFSKFWPKPRPSLQNVKAPIRRRRPRPFSRNGVRDFSEDGAIRRRRQIYNRSLYAKHIGANIHSRFKDISPQSFQKNKELLQRVTSFVRRELLVFTFLDDENRDFLLQYFIAIAKSLDLQSERAINMLGEILGRDRAEHFVHEVTTFARSPFTDITRFDAFVQYSEENGTKAKINEDHQEKHGSVSPSKRSGKARDDWPLTSSDGVWTADAVASSSHATSTR